MFNLIQPPKLPSQLAWKFSSEPELMGWAIRARDYNTFFANCVFVVMATALTAAFLGVHFMDKHASSTWLTIFWLLLYAVFMSIIYFNMTHSRINYAFRLTRSGVEYCKWKNFPEWTLSVLKWLAVVTGVIFLFIAIYEPAFLLGALAGPGGMGLMYLSIANSETYRALHSEYNHCDFKWEEITQLAIATDREIVDLKYHMGLKGGDPAEVWNFNIFCKRKQKEAVAELIKSHLAPDIPFIRVKLDMFLSTDKYGPAALKASSQA